MQYPFYGINSQTNLHTVIFIPMMVHTVLCCVFDDIHTHQKSFIILTSAYSEHHDNKTNNCRLIGQLHISELENKY